MKPEPKASVARTTGKKKQLALVAFLLLVLLLVITTFESGDHAPKAGGTTTNASLVTLKPNSQRSIVGGKDDLMERFIAVCELT